MLPEIPDNDTSTCWAPRCKDTPTAYTGLCFVHNAAIRPFLDGERAFSGRAYDLLGMRLNVLQESNRECLKASSPCTLVACRYHLDDSSHESPGVTGDDTCAIRLANSGPLTLEDIAVRSGVTRERVRQLEVTALRSLRRACERMGIRLEDVVGLKLKAA